MVFVTVVISYLIGAVSFPRVTARLIATGAKVKNFEMRAASSGKTYQVATVGAWSILDIFGTKVATIIIALDILKIVAIVLGFKLFFPDKDYYLIASLAGLAGHIWPIYYRIQGGYSFAVALGGLVVIDWLGAIVCPLAGAIFGVLVLREISAGLMVWSLAMIPWVWLRTHNLGYVAYAVGTNLLLMFALLPQIRMIIHNRRTGRTEFSLEGNPQG
jgi:glycerol-3-phosphate acyltransferase PlsY